MGRSFDTISEELIRLLRNSVAKHLGISLDKTVLRGGLRALKNVAAREHNKHLDEFLVWLLRDAPEKDRILYLARCFTIGETYFFRDMNLFLAIKNELIPKILERKKELGQERRVRIWSAGCSTGEEPYSLAMVLEGTNPTGAGWSYTIVATDVNEGFIARAREGRYRSWSFRKPIPEEYKKYFLQRNEEFEVVPIIKERVAFSVLNLIEDKYPSPATGTSRLDIIICRNVIMYLLPEYRQKVIDRFRQCLVKGGFLIITPAELHSVDTGAWECRILPGGAVLHKVDETAKIPARPERIYYPHRGLEAKGRPVDAGFMTPGAGIVKARTGSKEMLSDFLKKVPATSGSAHEDSTRQDRSRPLRQIADEIHEMANTGRFEEAMTLIDRHLDEARFDPELHYLKGALFQEMGRIDDALSAYRRAIYLDPQAVPALIALGTLLRTQGNRVAGNNFLREALSILKQKQEDEVLLFGENMSVVDLTDMLEAILENEDQEVE